MTTDNEVTFVGGDLDDTITVTGAGKSVTITANAAPGDIAYREANEIAGELNSISWGWPPPGQGSYNSYRPDDWSPKVTWGTPGQPTTYFNRSRCAEFVTALLQHSYLWATTSYFSTHFQSTSPNSARYYDKFVQGVPNLTTSNSTALDQVNELQAGSLIAIEYLDSESGTGDVSGHMMVVANTPTQVNRDSDSTTREWAVQVIDSTSNPHGVAVTSPSSPYQEFRDTRTLGAMEFAGVGRGWIFIRTGTDNRPQGYWWGRNENVVNEYHPVSERPMAFARAAT
jgi:hypothetical protein